MTGTLLGVVASLGGVLVGAVTTYLTQEHLWKRTTRRELYGSYVGTSNVCHDDLLAVRSTIKRKATTGGDSSRWEGDLKTGWGKANAQMAETSALCGQVSLVATEATRKAADRLERHLRDLKAELDQHNKSKTEPKEYDDYRTEYALARSKFLSAATREIGLGRTRWSPRRMKPLGIAAKDR